MTEQTKRVRRSKKQQFLDARDAFAKKQKVADDAKTLMQLAYAAWKSELEQMKNEFDEVGKEKHEQEI